MIFGGITYVLDFNKIKRQSVCLRNMKQLAKKKFVGTLAETKEKFLALLEKYPISKLEVVHTTTVTNDLTITDVDE